MTSLPEKIGVHTPPHYFVRGNVLPNMFQTVHALRASFRTIHLSPTKLRCGTTVLPTKAGYMAVGHKEEKLENGLNNDSSHRNPHSGNEEVCICIHIYISCVAIMRGLHQPEGRSFVVTMTKYKLN